MRDVGLQTHPDSDIWAYAQAHGEAVITQDKDFADIRAYPPPHAGIIIVDMPDVLTVATLLQLIVDGIGSLAGQSLTNTVVTITPGRRGRDIDSSTDRIADTQPRNTDIWVEMKEPGIIGVSRWRRTRQPAPARTQRAGALSLPATDATHVHFEPKKRWGKVAMKLISISDPSTASAAARRA